MSLRAAPGQHALLQVGLLAGARAVRVTGATLATLRTSDGGALVLPAGSFRPYSLGGSSPAGTNFTRTVDAAPHTSASLLFGLQLPAEPPPAAGVYTGVLTLHLESREAALTVRLTVHESAADAAAAVTASLQSAMPAAVPPFRPLGALGLAVDAAAVSAPYDELGSLARIAWVNSRAGIHERPPPGVAPIAAQTGGGELDKAPEVHFAFERSLAVGALGLPEQITVKGAELLAAPISVRAQVEKVQVEWRASRPVALANGTAAGVRWEAEGWARRSGPQTPPLSWRCTARAEYDGWVDLTVEIRAKSGEVQLQDVELRVPFRQQMSTYGLGMGFRGGRRPAQWAWSWDELRRGKRKYQRGDHAVWVGEVDGGLNVNLKGEEAEWEVPFGMEAKVPPAWSGTGGGDVLVVDEGGAAVVRARAGAHKVSPTKPLTLRFSQPTSRDSATARKEYVDALFSFEPSIGDDYRGAWADDSTFVITILDSTKQGGRLPDGRQWNRMPKAADLLGGNGDYKGESSIWARVIGEVRSLGLQSEKSMGYEPLKGNWGERKRAPALVKVAGFDRKNDNSVPSPGDTLTLTFDRWTNRGANARPGPTRAGARCRQARPLLPRPTSARMWCRTAQTRTERWCWGRCSTGSRDQGGRSWTCP